MAEARMQNIKAILAKFREEMPHLPHAREEHAYFEIKMRVALKRVVTFEVTSPRRNEIWDQLLFNSAGHTYDNNGEWAFFVDVFFHYLHSTYWTRNLTLRNEAVKWTTWRKSFYDKFADVLWDDIRDVLKLHINDSTLLSKFNTLHSQNLALIIVDQLLQLRPVEVSAADFATMPVKPTSHAFENYDSVRGVVDVPGQGPCLILAYKRLLNFLFLGVDALRRQEHQKTFTFELRIDCRRAFNYLRLLKSRSHFNEEETDEGIWFATWTSWLTSKLGVSLWRTFRDHISSLSFVNTNENGEMLIGGEEDTAYDAQRMLDFVLAATNFSFPNVTQICLDLAHRISSPHLFTQYWFTLPRSETLLPTFDPLRYINSLCIAGNEDNEQQKSRTALLKNKMPRVRDVRLFAHAEAYNSSYILYQEDEEDPVTPANNVHLSLLLRNFVTRDIAFHYSCDNSTGTLPLERAENDIRALQKMKFIESGINTIASESVSTLRMRYQQLETKIASTEHQFIKPTSTNEEEIEQIVQTETHALAAKIDNMVETSNNFNASLHYYSPEMDNIWKTRLRYANSLADIIATK